MSTGYARLLRRPQSESLAGLIETVRPWAIQHRHDPANIFRVGHNIESAGEQ